VTAGNGDRPGSGAGPETVPARKWCRPGSGDREREEVAAMGLLIQLAFIACMIALLVFLIQQYRRGNRKD
jgi:hypothetical protein